MGTVGRLDPFFQSIINSIMVQERQPLESLQQQKDSLNVQKKLYDGLRTRLADLQKLAKALISSDAFYAVKDSRKGSVTAGGEKAVISASVSSTAIAGSYEISITDLAVAHRVRSDKQTHVNDATKALGYSGEFYLGGAANRSAANFNGIADTVANGEVSTPDADLQELGTGTYRIEVRNDATSGWQFRLVNADGKAMSIKRADGQEGTTSAWQTIPSGGGTYDTGRGIKFDFATNPANYQEGTATIDYTAQAAVISVSSADSLNALAEKINNAKYGEGNEVMATVVDMQLILTSKYSGTTHTIEAHEKESYTVLQDMGIFTGTMTWKNQMNAASNASFTVNGIGVTRTQNSGLTDVISGVTLNLLGKSGTDEKDILTVTEDMSGATKAIEDFLAKFNEVQAFLNENTGITKIGENQYTRGGLADSTIFTDLRSNLFTKFLANYSTSGLYNNLRNIGLSIDDNLNAVISNSSTLQTALTDHLDDVKALLNEVMGAIDTELGRFTGSSGYLQSAINSFDNQISQITSDTKDMELRLTEKQQSLINQYSEMQTQLLSLQYMQATWASIYSNVSRLF